MEKIISSRDVFHGQVMDVSVKTVELQDGSTGTREVVHTNGAVAVLALNDEGQALFVRQWRTPVQRETLEIIAGRREPDEETAQTAQRELNEEGGLEAEKLELLTQFFQSLGYADGQTTMYKATGLSAPETKRPQDTGEFVTGEWLSLAEAKEAQKTGLICDAKTVLALALWENEVLRNG